MKLDFLPSGSPDCPLLRLYAPRPGEVTHLRHACTQLATGQLPEFSLHLQPWLDPIDRCQFTWRLGSQDLGVRFPTPDHPFILDYSPEAWLELHDKLEPFLVQTDGYTWLTNEGDINVLISPTGTW